MSRECSKLLAELGVRPIINLEARLTEIGGSRMTAVTLDAMRDIARHYVDLREFQFATGQAIAAATRNEDAYVSGGAAAGLALTVLASMTRGNEAAPWRLPSTEGLPTQVLIHAGHRVAYDRAIGLVGGSLRTFGNSRNTQVEELKYAITPQTAAILYIAGEHLSSSVLPLDTVIEIARRHSVPVIVDAAAQLPPASNLWKYSGAGADAVIFSGGKDLAAPQDAGLIVGKHWIIEACRALGPPNKFMTRPFKVSKEAIAGLYAALMQYLDIDHDTRRSKLTDDSQMLAATLSTINGVCAKVTPLNEAGQPLPRVILELDPDRISRSATDMRAELRAGWRGHARITVAADAPHTLSLTLETVTSEELREAQNCLVDYLSYCSK